MYLEVSIHLALMAGSCEHNNELSASTKHRKLVTRFVWQINKITCLLEHNGLLPFKGETS